MYLMIVSSHTAPRPLVLQMISHPYINLALDSLLNEPRAHQVLTMPGEGEAVPAEVEALRRSGREFLKNCLIPSKEIDGRKPTRQQRESYLRMMDTDVDANRIYGLGSQGHLFRLLEYGQMNGASSLGSPRCGVHACSTLLERGWSAPENLQTLI